MSGNYVDYFDTFNFHSAAKKLWHLASNILSDPEMGLQSKTKAERNQWK
jgi:hypothetical protein